MKRSGLLLLAALVAAVEARAGAEIRIVDADGSGEGLNDPTPATPVGGNPGTTVGEQRRIAFQYAASLWAATLGNQVPIAIKAQFQPLDCSGSLAVLGTAGPTKLYDGDQYPAALANERAGRDLDTDTEEIEAQFSSKVGTDGCTAPPWYYGLDDQAPGSQTDLVTVLLHEFAHGLGFFSASRGFLSNAQDDLSQTLLSRLSDSDYQAAIRRPMGVSWVGPTVRMEKNVILDQFDGVLELPGAAESWVVAKARFGGTPVDITAPLVRPVEASGGGATDACTSIQAVPGMLVIADRSGRCLVSRRAANAQAAGALGLVVRHDQSGDEPFSYGASDAGVGIVIPIWGISYDDGVEVEADLAAAPAVATVRAAARRAGENASGDVLLYTPGTYSAGSSLAHWTRTAIPSLLMEPIINPDVPRNLDLTVAALADVGWTVASGLSVGATKLVRADLVPGPTSYIVQVVNRSSGLATDVTLDAVADPALSFVSNTLDCTTPFPCLLGTLGPGEVRTVIAAYTLPPRFPRTITQTFQISGGTPAPDPRYASARVVASIANSGCSTAGGVPLSGLSWVGLLAIVLARRRVPPGPRSG